MMGQHCRFRRLVVLAVQMLVLLGGVFTLALLSSPDSRPAAAAQMQAADSSPQGSLDQHGSSRAGPTAVYSVTLVPPQASQWGSPGSASVYTFRLTNTGEVSDTFSLALGGHTWPVAAPAELGPLDPGVAADVPVTVTIPPETACNISDTVVITATSQGDSAAADSSVLVTNAEAVYSVSVAPAGASQPGDPGAAVEYTLRLTNTGNCSDTFDVIVSGNAWTTTVPAGVGPLSPGGGTDVAVTVAIPPDAPCGAADSAAVTFASSAAGTISATAILTTTANPVYAVALAPAGASQSGDPGTAVEYTLRLTNTGNCSDTFDVIVSGNAWTTTVPAGVGPLSPGGGTDVAVTVAIPPDAPCGAADSAAVTFASSAAGTISATAILTTTANPVYAVALAPAGASQSGDPGTAVEYTLRLTNTGNCADTFVRDLRDYTWPTTALPAALPLDPGQGGDIQVTVYVPVGSQCGDTDTVTVAYVSVGDGSVEGTSVLTTVANAVYTVQVEPGSASRSGDPGETVAYTLRVTNTGNCIDAYTITLGAHSWVVEAPSTIGPLGLGVGAQLPVSVTIPEWAQCDDWETVIVTALSQGDGQSQDSSSLTTSAQAIYDMALGPATSSLSGDPAEAVMHTLRVSNTGNCTDTYTVAVGPHRWQTEAPAEVAGVGPGEWAELPVVVTVPEAAQCGEMDSVVITVTSQGDGGIAHSSYLETFANTIYAVAVDPPAAAGFGDPSTTVTYTLRVTNSGNCMDMFDAAVSGNTWTTTVTATVGPLAPGERVDVTVRVDIPPDAQCQSDRATVTFTSQGDNTAAAWSTLTTTANTVFGVDLEPTALAQSGDPGVTVSYTLRLTNTGNCSDTFDVIVSGNTWTTTAPARVGPLSSGGGTDVAVTVEVLPGAPCGAADSAAVTFASSAVGTISATAILTTTANPVYTLTLAPASASQSGDPGTAVEYTLRLINTSNCADTFVRDLRDYTWPATALPAALPLDPGQGGDIQVTVYVPPESQCGETDTVTGAYVSVGDGSVEGTSVLTTVANAVYGVQVEPGSASKSGDPGETATYTLRVTNTANCMDVFTVTVSGNHWPTYAPASVGPLAAGTGADVGVRVEIPGGTGGSNLDTATLTFTSQGDLVTSATSVLRTTRISGEWHVYLPLVSKQWSSCFVGPWEIEDNDYEAQANGPLCSGRIYLAYPDDEEDWFTFVSNEGEITVQVRDYAPPDPYGQLILYDDQQNLKGSDNELSNGGDIHLPWLPAGRYYVRVYTREGFTQAVPYTLQVSFRSANAGRSPSPRDR